MQVHKILVATVLAASAFGAMSQELDPGETLQAKTLAAPHLQFAHRLAPVVAAVRDAQPAIQARADAVAAPDTSWAARHFTTAYARQWLHGDRRASRPVVVGEAN
jgi:hypothetical protein